MILVLIVVVFTSCNVLKIIVNLYEVCFLFRIFISPRDKVQIYFIYRCQYLLVRSGHCIFIIFKLCVSTVLDPGKGVCADPVGRDATLGVGDRGPQWGPVRVSRV
jgi:hypothetical protein